MPKEVIEPMIERIPLRRLGQPEDIANAFVFRASDEASYITGVISVSYTHLLAGIAQAVIRKTSSYSCPLLRK